MPARGHPTRPHVAEISARRAHQPVHRMKPAEATKTAVEAPRKRVSVFERLSNPEAPSLKRTVIGQKASLTPINTSVLPTEPFAPGRHDAEASSSGGKMTRRQRRRKNAELRAQHLLSEQPNIPPTLMPEASVPT